MKKDITILLGGFLTSLLLFFGTIGLSFEWFTQESINAFVVLISAFIALVINIYAVWKNTNKNHLKEKALKAQKLIKK